MMHGSTKLKFPRYCQGYMKFYAVFKFFYIFIPRFLAKSLSTFCGNLLVKHWSILSVKDQLDAQLRYIIRFFYYYDPLHVSSNSVLIIRRSNCINTASGIVFSVSAHRTATHCMTQLCIKLVIYPECHTRCTVRKT
jgi:hypothetical protein